MSRYMGSSNEIVDNGILFIIAIFFLACCVGCGTGKCGGGRGGCC